MVADAVGSSAACITGRGETIVLWTSWDGDGILLGSSRGVVVDDYLPGE
jgi:hypothetical protein